MYAQQRPVSLSLNEIKSGARVLPDARPLQHEQWVETEDQPWPFAVRLLIIAVLSVLCWAPIIGVGLYFMSV